MGQAGPLLQAAASGLQVQTRSQTVVAAYKESNSEQDEHEVGYSPLWEEVPSGAPTGKKGHRERLTMAKTRLDVLEASVEELYQGQGRLLGVESSQEEAKARIKKVESLIDQLTEDTKDFVRHLHEVVAELTAKVMVGRQQIDRSAAWWATMEATSKAIVGIAWEGRGMDDSYRGSKIATLIPDDRTPEGAL
ncbi:hypothetical protein GW17_00033124 [Ensete ventricosum]|nr:hypothetical protein GW17_00033124 [Ensete ventricosum]